MRLLTREQFVKQEDANKFRCKVPECTKLFKGTDFWRKHVEKRHPEFFANVVDMVQLVNTYVLDPAHIAPSRSDANSNGHFPLNNHAGPTGTPRGFQLNTQFPGMAFQPGMGSVGSGGLQMFPTPQMGLGMAAGFAGQMGYPGGVGPMRSMGRSSFSMNGGSGRMPGPYARNDGRGGPRGPPMMGGLGRGPAGGGSNLEGGASNMGPKQAVVGRQLRSYEDLDADNGAGTGELNY